MMWRQVALLWVCAGLASPLLAQTPDVPVASVHSHVVKKPVAKKKTVKKPVVPVLSPRHGVPKKPPVGHAGAKGAGAKGAGAKGAGAKGAGAKGAAAKVPAYPARKEVHRPSVKVAAVPKPVPKAPEPPPLPPNVGTVTKLPLPRYASLKTDDINMRVGPNERYPIMWTYKRAELPVKIEREFDLWLQVEDMDGIKGWVHKAMLTSRRTFVVTGTENRKLLASPDPTADTVAILKPGVVGRIRSCEAGRDWCQVQVQDYRGYLARTAFWGADPGEVVAP